MLKAFLDSRKMVLLAGLSLVLMLVFACGGSDEPPASAPSQASEKAQSKPKSPPNEHPTATAQAGAKAGVPTAAPAATKAPSSKTVKTKRLRYAIGAVANETNRPWAGSRQAFVQYEPMLETLLAKDVENGMIVPRLALTWDTDATMQNWTFKLRKGVEFHDGWGEFTAKDVMHTLKILCREDSRLSTCGSVTTRAERGDAIDYEEVMTIVDDYTIRFNGTRTNSIMPFLMGAQSYEMGVWSSDFWESEGETGLDAQGLVGTNTYQYLGREPGQSIILEKSDIAHWSGENPDFQEFEIAWIPEDATRYAGMLAGEIHVADLPIDLQQDSLTKGMKLIKSRFASNDVSIFFGGSYYANTPEDKEAYDETQPWNDVRVRQAMNLAINREELGNFLYADFWEHMYIDGFHESLEGWDSTWPERYKTEYAYNPEKAKELLAEAGYGPDNPVKVIANSYVSPGESELPQIMEAITLYWNRVGIETEIQDLDGSTVAGRYKGREMQHQVWPNIIIYFPIEYYMNIAYTSWGVTKHFDDDFLNATVKKLQVESNPQARDVIARDIGNHMFDQHVSMPLFWFPHTITVNPDVVEDWVYPGNTVPRLCCAAYAKAAN